MGINMGSEFESPDLRGEVVDWDEYRRWCDSIEPDNDLRADDRSDVDRDFWEESCEGED